MGLKKSTMSFVIYPDAADTADTIETKANDKARKFWNGRLYDIRFDYQNDGGLVGRVEVETVAI